MIGHMQLLGVMSAALGTGLTLASSPAGGASVAEPLPLTIVNNTGRYANTAIWIYIVGSEGGRQVRVTQDGRVVPIALADNGPDGYTDYAIPLAASGDTRLTLPPLSGRI